MLVYRHHRSSFFTLVFNPVTGAVMADDPCPLELDQALLLPETSSDLPRLVCSQFYLTNKCQQRWQTKNVGKNIRKLQLFTFFFSGRCCWWAGTTPP